MKHNTPSIINNSILYQNALINGDFKVAQRGTTFTAATTPVNSDDTYLLDRWIFLAEGADTCDVSQSTDVPTATGLAGAQYSCALDVETANLKFGILQIIENKDAIRLWQNATGKVSLSFKARVSNTRINDVRAVVLAWDSTADTVTSDIVSAWNTDATPPTYVANWTAENVDSNLGVTTSWAEYKIENISLDTASTANLAVFIYSCTTVSNPDAGDFLYITDVQLVPGAVAPAYQPRPFEAELALCQRFYEKSFDLSQAPVQASGTLVGTSAAIQAVNAQGSDRSVFFAVHKRVVPTVTTYNPTQAAATFRNTGDTANANVSGVNAGESMFRVRNNGGAVDNWCIHWQAEAEL